jgi:hypothetical protein
MSAIVNWHSLLNDMFCSEFVIRYRNYVGCSELTFAAEIELVASNQFSLPN